MKSNRLIKNMGFYFLGTFSTKILQFIFTPFYSKYIDPSHFGYYSLVVSMVALLIPLLYQSIWEAVLRYVIENEGEEKYVLATSSSYLIGLTIIYSIIFLFGFFIFNIEYGIAILIMAISQMGIMYYQFSARALKKNYIYAISTVIHSITTIILNVVLIIIFRWGLLALFIANTVGNIISIYILEKNLKIISQYRIKDFKKSILIKMIKYSFPLSINGASWWLITSFNNFTIAYKISIDENGIYSMANRFGSIMSLLTTVISLAWVEESFRVFNTKGSDKYFNDVLNLLVKVVLSGVTLLIPITYIFYAVFIAEEYSSGVILTPIIYLTAAYSAISSHLASIFLARKESGILLRTTLVGGVFSAVGGFLMADHFGVMGVVITSLMGYIIMFLIRVPMIRKRIVLKFDFLSLVSLTGISIMTMYIANIYQESIPGLLLLFFVMFVLMLVINFDIVKKLCKRALGMFNKN